MVNKVLLVLLVLFLSAHVMSAQENGEALSADKLFSMPFEDLMHIRVVTPTLNLQSSDQVPATVMVVTQDQIRLRGYGNLAEILSDLPDFTVQDKTDPQFYNVVSARGVFRQDHFVILLDGVRISSPTNEPLPVLENFPIYLAEQIEIVYGPGSALYGADAMAGVINIITKKTGGGRNLTASAIGGTQGYTNVNTLFNKKLKNGMVISLGGQYAYDAQPDFSKIYKDDYNMTSHKTGVFNTTYGAITPQQPVSSKYEAPLKTYNLYSSIDKDGFAVRILHHYAQVPSSTTLKPNNGVYNKDVFYGQGVTTASASYTASAGKWKSVSTLVGSFYKVNPKSNFRNLYGAIEQGYKFSTGSMIKAEEQVNYTFSKKLNFIGGITYELFQSIPKTPELQSPVETEGAVSGVLLNSVAENNPAGIEAKIFSLLYTNIGSYLQGQYSPLEKLSFTVGARFDHNSRFGSTFNPRLGAVFSPFENTTVKTVYGTAFWAPSPMVSFESYGSFYTMDNGSSYQSGFWHLPNPDLKPMTSRTMELSISQEFSKQFSATLTVYRSEIDNMIRGVSDNGNTNLYNNKFLGWDVYYIEVPFNLGNQVNQGGNLRVNSTFKVGKVNFNVWSSVSYLEGKVSINDTQAPVTEAEQAATIPWQLRAGLDGKAGVFQFSVRLLQAGRQRTATFAGGDDPYSRKTISGYSLLNLSAGYTFRDRATFFVNVQNALDQRYRNVLDWDASDPNAESFSSSFQNPLRLMTGIRIGF